MRVWTHRSWLIRETGTRVNIKIWPKIQHKSAYNFSTSDNNPRKLYQATSCEAGVIMWVQILEGCPHSNLKGEKRPKFAAIFDNFGLWSQISQEQIGVSKIWKVLDQQSPIGRKKFGELWSTNKKVIGTHVDPPKWTLSRDYISSLIGVLPSSNFYTWYNPLNCISGRTWGAGGLMLGSAPYF